MPIADLFNNDIWYDNVNATNAINNYDGKYHFNVPSTKIVFDDDEDDENVDNIFIFYSYYYY